MNKTDIGPIFMEHLPGKDSQACRACLAPSTSGLQTEKTLKKKKKNHLFSQLHQTEARIKATHH